VQALLRHLLQVGEAVQEEEGLQEILGEEVPHILSRLPSPCLRQANDKVLLAEDALQVKKAVPQGLQ
jgi:hypothetical protein